MFDNSHVRPKSGVRIIKKGVVLCPLRPQICCKLMAKVITKLSSGACKGPFCMEMEPKKVDKLITSTIFKILHTQDRFWKLWNWTSIMQPSFCVTNGRSIDFINPQLMHSIVCYNEQVSPTFLAQWTRCLKGLITYFKTNVIIAMKKHVQFKHSKLTQKLAKELSSK